MPTEAECQELIDNCTWQWTTVGGHKGYRVTSKRNGNSIFLPAAGDRYTTQLNNADEWGYYWSSSPYGSIGYSAYYIYFSSGYRRVDWLNRYHGVSIRPVSE